MPIDWDSVAEPFRVPVGLQIKSFVDAFQLLARTLSRRLEQTRASERASREFPIIRFYNGAVTLWVDRWQHGALGGDAGPPSVWDTLRASGQAFVGGLGRIVT